MIMCSLNRLFSLTTPKMSPCDRISPSLIFLGSNCQSLVGFSEGTSTPFGTNIDFEYSAMTCRGLWIPSKIWSRIPGPSSTERGCLVLSTGSPTVKPARHKRSNYMYPHNTGYRLSRFRV
jgi:hypothetical protein